MVKIRGTELVWVPLSLSGYWFLDLKFLADNYSYSLTSESGGNDSYETHQSHDPEDRVHRTDEETANARRS